MKKKQNFKQNLGSTQSMEMGEKRVVVEHVGKGVILDREKQMCRWVRIAKKF
jgi:hypothetical protein